VSFGSAADWKMKNCTY